MSRSDDARQTLLRQSFDELESLREHIEGWDLDLVQLERGPFEGHLHQWQSGPLFLSRAKFGRKLLQRGASPDGGLTLAVPASNACGLRWRGQNVGNDQIMVFPTNGELDAVSSSGFDVYTITFGVAAWPQCDASGLGEKVTAQLGHACRCSTESMRQLRRVLRRSESSPDGPTAQEWMTIQVLALEAVCSRDGHSGSAQNAVARRRALRAAVEYMDSRLHRAIRIADLCRETGVSERTLQYAFQSEFGLSPMSYLNARRLHRVRAELLRSRPRHGSIARTARAHGLRHPGRFAADYQAMFGELPSQTARDTERGLSHVP